ncbi:MAG: carboxypeptidase-like regulatory domain-containing protein [Bacteroidales bacterium]|nr:carboxypeptidase-like regulatory domain-containing protein [Bacteroidales bacterium]
MKKFSFLLFCMVLLFSANTYAQTIKGQVVDQVSSQSIAGAMVYIKGTSIGTVTDLDGFFEFNTNKSVTTIKVSSIGYNDVEQNISFNDDAVIDLNQILLSPVQNNTNNSYNNK